jgi:hypothetical protein
MAVLGVHVDDPSVAVEGVPASDRMTGSMHGRGTAATHDS